ncbi:MAG: energy-coupling factor ABC transporter permease [Planctomycetaceae bacterium]|nr:energy-coupling factor ABC transporter permease [Planctomycetaceae bacterium]
MHLGNGAITPECAAITLGAAAVGLGAAAAAIRRASVSRQKLALAAGLGALVFAAQAVNVPVLPGISAHLVGGVLLAWVLGPGLGAWTLAVVLAVQALWLGDGGLAALGANIVNMALVPAGCVALCRRWKATGHCLARSSTTGHCWASQQWHPTAYATCAAAAAVSVPLAALAIVGETALFRSGTDLIGWQAFAAQMILVHLWIGLLEGGVTLAAVAGIAWLGGLAGTPQRAFPTGAPAWACFTLAMALAAFALPWSSSLPDGYEAAAEASGLGAWLVGRVHE